MSMAAKLRRAPMRIATGAFILNSGLQKLSADDESAKGVHGMAAGAYPAFESTAAEVVRAHARHRRDHAGRGAADADRPRLARRRRAGRLLRCAAGMWWRTPGMHEEGSPRPTQQGTAIAKDSWMLGIGTGLVLDHLLSDATTRRAVRRAEHRAERRARKHSD